MDLASLGQKPESWLSPWTAGRAWGGPCHLWILGLSMPNPGTERGAERAPDAQLCSRVPPWGEDGSSPHAEAPPRQVKQARSALSVRGTLLSVPMGRTSGEHTGTRLVWHLGEAAGSKAKQQTHYLTLPMHLSNIYIKKKKMDSKSLQFSSLSQRNGPP